MLSFHSSTSAATGQLVDQVEQIAAQLSHLDDAHIRISRAAGLWEVWIYVADELGGVHVERALPDSPPIVTGKHECLDNALFEVLVKCCAITAELHTEGVMPA